MTATVEVVALLHVCSRSSRTDQLTSDIDAGGVLTANYKPSIRSQFSDYVVLVYREFGILFSYFLLIVIHVAPLVGC